MKLTLEILRRLIQEQIDEAMTAAQEKIEIASLTSKLPRNKEDAMRVAARLRDEAAKITDEEDEDEGPIEETFVDKRKKSADKHFNKSQSPGEADDTWHNCMVDVKKDGKSLESAAKICTKSREQGGATLKWGEKRKKEVRAARPGGMK